MKKLLFLIIISTTFHSFAQESIPDTAEMCKTLRKMVENDQIYRNGKILKDGKFGSKSIYPKKIKDSVWVLQRKLDVSNTEKLIKLTKKYGWIPDERINCDKLNVWLIFRHSDKKYYQEIDELIEKEHNAKRLNDFYYKLIKDHVTGKY